MLQINKKKLNLARLAGIITQQGTVEIKVRYNGYQSFGFVFNKVNTKCTLLSVKESFMRNHL